MLFLFGFVLALPFLACVVLLFRSHSPRTPFVLARAVGWCTLCAAPAILLQDGLVLFGGSSTSFSAADCLKAFPFQVFVLQGGALVQLAFEDTAKALSGHRQSTMMDNWAIYCAYTWIWTLAWAALVRTREAVRPSWKDPVRWVVATILVVNALAGAWWPWWGT